jgi:acetylornithine deacetylase ArgE
MATGLVDELARLVAFPTVSNQPVIELAAHLARRHEDRGLRVERFVAPDDATKLNIVASMGPRGTDGLVLTGHMDVVPTEGQPWSTDPFEATERDGRIYGRGTADMKGFIAATLRALDRIRTSELTRELVLVWTHDEEVGCIGSAHLAKALESAGRRLPTQCLVGEPTDFHILRMHPGHVAVRIRVPGIAAHSSRPDLGVNAIERAMFVVAELRELAAQLESERADIPEMARPWVAFNIARVQGGSAINIPAPHRLQHRVRAHPGDAVDAHPTWRTAGAPAVGARCPPRHRSSLLRDGRGQPEALWLSTPGLWPRQHRSGAQGERVRSGRRPAPGGRDHRAGHPQPVLHLAGSATIKSGSLELVILICRNEVAMSDSDRLLTRLSSRGETGLFRRQMRDGGEVFSGPTASRALKAIGARAMTMDHTIFVDEGFDQENPEDQALYAHERLHQLESGGTDDHGDHDAEEVAARAIERMVLHRSAKGDDFGTIMRDVAEHRSAAPDVHAAIGREENHGSEPEDPVEAQIQSGYAALAAQGKNRGQIVDMLADHVVDALRKQHEERLYRGPASDFD